MSQRGPDSPACHIETSTETDSRDQSPRVCSRVYASIGEIGASKHGFQSTTVKS